MRHRILTLLACSLLFMPLSAQNRAPLLDSSCLHYVGSFNAPANSSSIGETFAWSGQGVTYNPHNNSLFITGHNHYQLIGEISIPQLSINSDPAELNFSELLQPLTDITEGHIAEIGVNGEALSSNNNNMKIGGLLVSGNTLIGTSFPYYESATYEDRSHFLSSLDLSASGDYNGMYKIGTQRPGITSGYMCHIPSEWQDEFEAKALTGNACIPVISRSSLGPSISTFSPDSLVMGVPNNSTVLIEYPDNHMTLGTYVNETEANPVFNMTTTVNGVAFPVGSQTVLFFGRTGLGIPEYGAGTDDINMDGVQVEGYDEFYVYDPANPLSKGGHAWPYTAYVWAYDATDLLSVKKGEKEPWEVVPYAHWQLNLPFGDTLSTFTLGGVAYDPTRNRLYVSQQRIRRERPVIHAFDINSDASLKKSTKVVDTQGIALKITGSNLHLQTTHISEGTYTIYQTNLQGKRLLLQRLHLRPYSSISLTLSESLATGVYLIEIEGTDFTYLKKVVRN